MADLLATLSDDTREKVHRPTDDWSDQFALYVAKADFEQAEIYRTNNHDSRWSMADMLYAGYEKQRVWEGTKIPRSSLGMFVVFSQIESLLPKVLSTIFADSPNWFEAGPEAGTTPTQAQQVRDLMLSQMEQARKLKNQSIREVTRRAMKSGLLYGAGIVELCWLDITEKRKKLFREYVPMTKAMSDPVYGKVEVPTGEREMQLTERIVEQRRQMPFMRHVSTKDFYIDPNCQCPQVQAGRFACTRAMMTIDDVLALKDSPGFNVPGLERLKKLAENKPTAMGDQTKANTEAARQGNWHPSADTTADMGGHKIECITYWTSDRCVWMLNREEIIYNEVNHYGFIPLFNTFYVDFPDRFYGLSVTDVVEGEHRVQGAIINSRMDELSLKIHGGMVKKRGRSISTTQLRRRPGRIIEADNPKEDVVPEQIPEITPQSFMEINASELRVQKNTGITDLAVMGTPSAGGNSANRTATGISTQAQAAFSRLTYIVENSEDTFVEPMLSAWHMMNTIFLDPSKYLHIFGNQVDPLSIINADVNFTMRASSKMQSRQVLMQTFPIFSQTLLNPAFMQSLQAQGKTIDMAEIASIIVDMTGYKTRGDLIRPLTEEEKKAIEAAKSEEHLKLKMQRERMQDLEKLQAQQNEADMQKTIVEKGFDMAMQPDEKEDKE